MMRYLVTFLLLLNVNAAAVEIPKSDVYAAEGVCLQYEKNAFQIVDASGHKHEIPADSLKELNNVPAEQIVDLLCSGEMWFKVTELYKSRDETEYGLKAYFRLRGGRPITQSNKDCYTVSVPEGGREAASDLRRELSAALQAQIESLEKELRHIEKIQERLEKLLSESGSDQKCKHAPTTSATTTACRAAYSAAGAAIGSKFLGKVGTVGGAVAGELMGSAMCDPKGTGQAVKSWVVSGVKAYDAHIRHSTYEKESGYAPDRSASSAYVPSGYEALCPGGKCKGSAEIAIEALSRTRQPHADQAGRDAPGGMSFSYDPAVGGFSVPAGPRDTSDGGSSGSDGGDGCCIM